MSDDNAKEPLILMAKAEPHWDDAETQMLNAMVDMSFNNSLVSDEGIIRVLEYVLERKKGQNK